MAPLHNRELVGRGADQAVLPRIDTDVETVPRYGHGVRYDPRDSSSRRAHLRYLTGCSLDAPPSEALQKALPKLLPLYQKKGLELKIKLVQTMDVSAPTSPPSHNAETFEFIRPLLAYLSDDKLYDCVKSDAKPIHTAFTADEERHGFRPQGSTIL